MGDEKKEYVKICPHCKHVGKKVEMWTEEEVAAANNKTIVCPKCNQPNTHIGDPPEYYKVWTSKEVIFEFIGSRANSGAIISIEHCLELFDRFTLDEADWEKIYGFCNKGARHYVEKAINERKIERKDIYLSGAGDWCALLVYISAEYLPKDRNLLD